MRVLDLFCGAAGGWSLGLHRAGAFDTIAACEIDDWRRVAFSRNFPNARMYADVRQLTGDVLRADGLVPDIVVGSPPCQDASTANAKGKGVDGERTGLFFDAVRLVRDLRPRWACFENVPGLRTRGYDRVHDALEAAGYAVRPLVVGAWHAGAPHRRNRVWIIANDADTAVVFGASVARHQPDGFDAGVAADSDSAEPIGRSATGRRLRGAQAASGTRIPADANETRLALRESLGSDDGAECSPVERDGLFARHPWNGGAPDLGGMDDGLPKGMARRMLSAYGDAVVPAVTELIGRAILHAEAAQREAVNA